ncbi:thymidylate synthase [Candidatus Micrarchaeota archaeon]|nr:thymidylate synthase [Candidatus Micrarchaeota archaeon]MBI5176694.1 thymidylate synthase [Candidatus Micrarchaeota archaeon]
MDNPDSGRHPEFQYLDLLRDIMQHGVEKRDHNTGVALKSVFGRSSRYDLSQGFPLLTTKRVYWKGVLHELYWFLSGQSNIKYLVDNDVHIWDDYPYKIYLKKTMGAGGEPVSKDEFVQNIRGDAQFAREWGELPHIYGAQWRHWPAKGGREIDQAAWVVDTLKNFPDRKHAVLSVWNPEFLYGMALPGEALSFPLCHILLHFNVSQGKLSCMLYQRSCDMFLGVPFNIASYALLTHVIARACGYSPGELVHNYGDAHVYSNHYEQVNEQLSREPRPFPTIGISDAVTSIDSFRPELVTLENYNPHPSIKGELTVAGGFDEKDRTMNKA